MFPDNGRLNTVHGNEGDCNPSAHMNTAYKALAEDISEFYDDGSLEITFIGQPQEVSLPFDAKADILWEL